MSADRAEPRAALLDAVRLRLAEYSGDPTPSRVAAALRAEGRLLGDTEVLGVVTALRSEMVGAGPLEPLLADPDVTDVLVNGPDEVWVDRGHGLVRSDVGFADAAAVRRLAQRLATTAGRRLDDARPWVDARLPDGTRLHAVLPPVVVGSPCLSLRVVRARAFALDELIAAGTMDAETARLLRAVLDARLSFMISGGTGTGKTTLLSCLLGLVEPDLRIVLAEDSAELRPDHPHVVRLETRPANQEGAGLVELRDLVRQALRMRPDRLVVGEVRGPEVTELLAALNTGHEGGCGTIHANAAGDVPARLEALGSTAGLDRAALHSQLAAALSVVVHLARDRSGLRRVAEVHVLERRADGMVVTVPAVMRGAHGAGERGPGWDRLAGLCERGAS
ncbi:TadA family conjugal transfer-associated ATPase [Streptomyces sp. SID13666]|uniref:TadA family conjugal transfer-associated ATPase n=1 Tax=unclassified Streptomyces TaxID=2593676 RepID=UPI0013C18FED|nr:MULTISPECIES: TadA family conjugal transfer-associated ATPase [unclassified Streptomyces]NEA59464.1 TadA family conjugal transfer-associated ATPase [Streptomyces sp. SID13666]NEA72416.1 TadA family conjugal transfer-associated ATPase [Streptomyces sp. SID13588]